MARRSVPRLFLQMVAAFAALGISAEALAENWPHWRGPNGNGSSSPALYDERLYFTKSNRGLFVAVDASSGESVISEQRLPDIDTIYASPVAAKDRIYVSGREGTTVVLRHAPTFEVLATNRLDDVLDASPAMVGDLLYLRGEKYLYCIGDSADD